MKRLIWALSFVFLTSASSANESLEFGEIVKATRNAMFPVATVKLTVMKPCFAKVVGAFQQKNENVIRVGVLLESNDAAATCLAMPAEEEVVARIFSETPFTLEIINAKAGLTVESDPEGSRDFRDCHHVSVGRDLNSGNKFECNIGTGILYNTYQECMGMCR